MTMLTEEQARKKWCPFVRLHDDEGSFNRVTWYAKDEPEPFWHDLAKQGNRCIASDCMAWQWRTVVVDKRTGEPVEPGTVYQIEDTKKSISIRGYCGLASKS